MLLAGCYIIVLFKLKNLAANNVITHQNPLFILEIAVEKQFAQIPFLTFYFLLFLWPEQNRTDTFVIAEMHLSFYIINQIKLSNHIHEKQSLLLFYYIISHYYVMGSYSPVCSFKRSPFFIISLNPGLSKSFKTTRIFQSLGKDSKTKHWVCLFQ